MTCLALIIVIIAFLVFGIALLPALIAAVFGFGIVAIVFWAIAKIIELFDL